jgi:hypothetical protein
MFLELKTAAGLYRINADEAAWISTEPSGVVVLHGAGTEDEVHLGDYLPLTLPKGAVRIGACSPFMVASRT